MALFKKDDIDKPGISKNEPKKLRFFLFFELYFRKFWQLILLNIIYILCCLPIITIGPATAALTYVLRNFVREVPVFPIADFFDQFKKNFKQGFIIGLIDILAIGIFSFSFMFYYNVLSGTIKMNISPIFALALNGLALASLYIYFTMRYYFYTMLVTFDFKIWQILKNGFIFSIVGLGRNFITTFFVAALSIGVYFLFFLSPIIFFFVITLIFFTLTGFIITFNSFPLIKKYLYDPEVEKMQQEKAAKGIVDEEPIFSDERLIK